MKNNISEEEKTEEMAYEDGKIGSEQIKVPSKVMKNSNEESYSDSMLMLFNDFGESGVQEEGTPKNPNEVDVAKVLSAIEEVSFSQESILNDIAEFSGKEVKEEPNEDKGTAPN